MFYTYIQQVESTFETDRRNIIAISGYISSQEKQSNWYLAGIEARTAQLEVKESISVQGGVESSVTSLPNARRQVSRPNILTHIAGYDGCLAFDDGMITMQKDQVLLPR
jgi:hypothetical protein